MDQKEVNKLRSEIQLAFQHLRNGEREAAGDIYDRVSESAGAHPVLNCDLGQLCSRFGATDKALRHLRIAIEQEPDEPDYRSYLGLALLQSGENSEARELLENVLLTQPDHTSALYGMGILSLNEGDYEQARERLEQVLKSRPKESNILLNLGKVYANLGDYDKGVEFLNKAVKANPQDRDVQAALGELLAEAGNQEAVQKHFEKIIRSGNNVGFAYSSLARLRKFSDKDRAFITRAEKSLGQGMPPQERYLTHFALGKMYDDCEQFDKAWGHFKQANLLQKGAYDPKRDQIWQKLVKKAFTADSIRTMSSRGHDSTLPVFIVGMPRSGTTLLERLIGSHSQADGAGELIEMPTILNSLIDVASPRNASNLHKRLDEAESRRHAERYLKALTRKSAENSRVVDKLPGNFISVGLILSLFPNAKIIHLSRHPLDTCLSCYFQPFQDIAWANDFKDIAAMYEIYRGYMDYWKTILPAERILDVQYESLVENSEVESKRVLEHCGLEWEPEILKFHQQDAAVRTASRWQVRQAIYKTSKMRWKGYAAHLSELAQDLSGYLQEDRENLAEKGISLKNPRRFKLFG